MLPHLLCHIPILNNAIPADRVVDGKAGARGDKDIISVDEFLLAIGVVLAVICWD